MSRKKPTAGIKCPIFQTECLQEKCTAFTYRAHSICSGYRIDGTPIIVGQTHAIYPYCAMLKVDLPYEPDPEGCDIDPAYEAEL